MIRCGFHGKDQFGLLAVCLLREAAERAIGRVSATLRLPKPDRRAGKWGVTVATHAPMRGLAPVGNLDGRKAFQTGASDSVKRLKLISSENPTGSFSENAQGLYKIRDYLESKTTWHPIGA